MSGMSSESRERISGLYHAALAYPAKERRAFLQAACGDDEALRLEVESLLAYEAASSGSWKHPPRAAGISMVNQQVGPYTIVAPLGAGGMGEVYRARQQQQSPP
jgi:hypothetical protein